MPSLFDMWIDLSLRGRKEVDKSLDAVEKKVDRLGAKKASPTITARTEAADKKIDALGAKLERLDDFRAEAEADVDTKNGLRSLEAFEKQLDSFGKEVARARADVQTTEGQRRLRDLESDLQDFRKQSAVARARIETSGEKELTGLSGLLRRFAGQKATATAGIEASGQSELTGLRALLARFGATKAEAKIGIDGGAASVAQLGAVNAAANRVDGRRINLGFNPSLGGLIDRVNNGLSQTATRIRAFSTVGTAAAIPVLIAAIGGIVPVATAAAAAVGGLASAVAQGLVGALGAGAAGATGFLAGVGLIAAAAGRTVKVLSENETATNQLATAQKQADSASQAYADAQRGVQDASRGVADAQRSASEGVAQAQAAYQDSLGAVVEAERGVEEAARAVGDARREASAGVADAQQAYRDSLRDVEDAERGLAEATRAVGDARRDASAGVAEAQADYQDSLRGVEDAERGLAEATRKVGDARREASEGVAEAQQAYQDSLRGVQDAERDLVESRRTLNDATVELRGAQQDLNSAMEDEPRNQAYATLDLADARDAASDATREYNEAVAEYGANSEEATDADRRRQRAQLDLQETEREVAETRRNGSDELQSAREGVESASEAERQARNGVADSERALQDARQESANAAAGIAKAQQEGARGVAEAQQGVADAQRGVAEANRAAAEAARGIDEARIEGARGVADAQQGVADAQRGVADANRAAAEAARGIDEARIEGARQVADAQQGVADAQRTVADAVRASSEAQAGIERARIDGARQVADAQRQVADAQRRVAEAAQESSLAQKVLEAAGLATGASLTASQQTLLGKLKEVSAQYISTFRAANDAFNYLAVDVLDFASGALPTLGRASEAAIGGLARAFQTLRGELSSGAQLGVFNTFLAAVPGFVQSGTEALGRLGMVLANTLTAAIPAGQRLFGAINSGLETLAARTRSVAGQRALTAYFDQAYQKAVILSGAMVDLVAGVIGLGGAFDESGLSGRMLQGLADMAARFRAFTAAGSQGRAMLVSFSTAAQPTLDATWRLLGAIFTEWGRVANALIRARNEAGKLVVPQALDGIRAALPVIGRLLIDTFTRFGPMIGPLVSGLAGLLNVFVAHNPVLQRLSQIVVGVLTAFNSLPGPIKTVIASVVSLASIFSVLGISFGAVASVAFAGMLPVMAAVAASAAGLGVAAMVISRNWGAISSVFAPLGPALNRLKATFRSLGVVIRGLFTGNTGVAQFRQAFASLPGPVQNAVKLIVIAWRSLKTSFVQAWGQIRPILTQIGSGIKTALGTALRFLVSQGRQAAASFRQNWPQIKAAVLPIVQAIAGGIRIGLGTAFRFLLSQARQVISWFRQNWPQIKAVSAGVFQAVVGVIRNVLIPAFKFVLSNAKIIVNWFRQNWPLIKQTTLTVFNAVKAVVTGTMRAIIAVARPIITALVAFWRTNSNQILGIARSVWSIIKTVIQTAIRAVLGIIKATMQAITGDWRGAWQTIRGIINTVWDAIKSIVRSALGILKSVIQIAWNNIKAITGAAFRAVRDAITDRIREARRNFETAVDNIKSIAMRVFESMPGPIQSIFRKIEGFISDPIGTAVENVRGFLYDLIGLVNKVLEAVKLDPIKVIFGQGGGGPPPDSGGIERRGLAKGGVTTDPNMGEAFARGGVSGMRRARPERFARGGMGTEGRNPRVHMWNEQMGKEGYAVEDRPSREQLPYIQEMAGWHDYAVVPANPAKAGVSAGFAEGGVYPMRAFAGGGIGALYDAVKSKFGVEGFNRHTYLSYPASRDSLDFMVTTPGNRAEGAEKTLGDNIAAFTAPPSSVTTIWYGSANYGDGWQGYSGTSGIGNSNTLGHYDHPHVQAFPDQFRGAQGTFAPGSGGGGGSVSVPNPLQIAFEAAWKRSVTPLVNRIIEPLENSKNKIVNIAGAAGRMVPKGIYSWIDEKIPDTIGGGGSTTATGNFSGSKQDMAMTFAKNAVSRGMPGRLPVMTSMQELGGYWFGDTDDYRSVTGYSSAADHDSLGFFQQRPSTGWGSPEQIMDPAYALGKFLDAAEPFKGQYSNDPGGLSGWAQAVQRSAFPDAYAKHWDAAGKVIGDPEYYEKGGRVPGRDGEAKLLMAHAGEIILPRGLSDAFVNFSRGIEGFVRRSPLAKIRTALEGVDPERFRPPEIRGVSPASRQYRSQAYPGASSRAAIQASRSAMGTTQLADTFKRELQGLRQDLVSAGIKVSGYGEQAREIIVAGSENGARRVMKSTEGKGIIQTQNREINKTQSLRRGR